MNAKRRPGRDADRNAGDCAPDFTASAAEFLSVAELAAWLNVDPRVIYHLNYTGEGPRRYRIGRELRYRRADVEVWLATRAEPAPASQIRVVGAYPRRAAS